MIKQQFDFHKTRPRSLAKNRCKIKVLAALTNQCLAQRQLIASA
jgi:IS5 family transposase